MQYSIIGKVAIIRLQVSKFEALLIQFEFRAPNMEEDTEIKHLNNEKMDIDDILLKIGEFGKYQKLLVWLVCLPACFPCGFCAFNQLFMAEVPEHWCKVSQLSHFSSEERRNLSIPFNNESFAKCQRYALNWTEVLENSEGPLEGIIIANKSWPTEGCTEGWEYDKNIVHSSIVIDFDLVCDKDMYPTLGLVALNTGGPIGVYSFGRLNDSIGRKKSFFLCLTTLLLGSILTCASNNFWLWAGSRIIVGLTIPAIYQIPFIISLELVGPNYRSFVTVLTCIFYTFGLMMLSGITYFIRNWVYAGLATSTPFILYYFYWICLPESPRWLITKGKFDEAFKILETLARINGRELPFNFKQQLKQEMNCKPILDEEEVLRKSPGCYYLFKTPNMRLKTTLITFNWFANEMVYVGLSYYGPSLGNNKYLSFLLSSVVEIPGYLACWLIMDRWGRRWPLCLSMIVSGICCIVTVLIPSEDATAILILYLISKSTISASFLIIYPFAGELYPTQLRGMGIGTSAYIAGLGLIIIPFITYMGSDMLVLPLIIMGVISVVGGLASLRLPETLHYSLPQTVEEGEEFGKDFTLADCIRCTPLKPAASSEPSYEDLEMASVQRKLSIKKLARQNTIETQTSADGVMQMTYWF